MAGAAIAGRVGGGRTVETDEALAEWVSVYCACFGVPDTAVDDTLRAEAERVDAGPVVRFAATVEGRTVGTALLLTTHDVAGIYVVTTLPEHRRRGPRDRPRTRTSGRHAAGQPAG